MRTSAVNVRVSLPRAQGSRFTILGVVFALVWCTAAAIVYVTVGIVRLGIALALWTHDYTKRRVRDTHR